MNEWMHQWLLQHQGWHLYSGFVGILWVCGMGAPMNSDLVLVTAGVLAGLGYLQMEWLIPLALLAISGGDASTFLISSKFGRQLLQRCWIQRLIPTEKFERASRYFNTRGAYFLFCIRFFPGVRTVLIFTAGTLGVSPKKFFPLNALSTLIYVPALLAFAYQCGLQIHSADPATLREILEKAKPAILGVLGVALAVLVVKVLLARRTAVRGYLK